MNVRRLSLLAACGAAAVVPAVPALASPSAHAARSARVILKHDRFHRRTVHVSRGGTVTWVWRDHGRAHNVIAPSFSSPTKTRGKFRVRFTRRGTFRYVCTIHPGMTGKVVVR